MKKLSDRTLSLPVSAALAVDLKAKALAGEGCSIINFCVGEPDLPTPSSVCVSGIRAIADGNTKYTNAPGTIELRQAIADSLRERYAISYQPNEIAVTTGGKYAVYAAMLTLTDPGDEVLLPAPYWTSYYHIITLCGAVPVVIPTDAQCGFKVTPEKIREYATSKTKAIILNNPNNPSGVVYGKGELLELAKVFQELDLYVVSDEIYDRFLFTREPFTSIPSLSEDMFQRTVLINGVSKAFAMTGWRIGYAAAPRSIIAPISAVLSHTTGCPNAIAQKAAETALKSAEADSAAMREIFRIRRNMLVDGLSDIEGISFPTPEGAFYCMVSLTGRLKEIYPTGNDFSMALLEKAGVATVPCADYGMPCAVRLSYSIDDDSIAEGIRRIRAFCEGTLKDETK